MTTPKPGDIFATKVSGLVGTMIYDMQRLVGEPEEYAQWTHCGLYVGDGQVFEAQPGGARKTSLSAYEGRPMRWSTGIIQPTALQRTAILGATLALDGTPYSFVDYGSIGLYRAHVRPDWVKDYVQSTGHMICSQIVDEAYKRAGIHLFQDDRLPQDVIPANIAWLMDTWQ